MATPEIQRSLTEVIKNSLPIYHLGCWLNDSFGMELGISPPYGDIKITVGVKPFFAVIDAQTKNELYRFQTNTNFIFVGKYSQFLTHQLVYETIMIAVDEFNLELKKSKSTLAIHREFPKPPFEEILPQINKAFALNSFEKKTNIKPHWREYPDILKNTVDNDILIDNLPAIPDTKRYSDRFTEELQVLFRYIHTKEVDDKDEKTLLQAIHFYENCFPKLKEINLFALTDEQANKLKTYLSQVFNITFLMFNDLTFDLLFRVTIITDDYIENGKVRKKEWLTYPPLELIKNHGVYNRANSPNRTVFYASGYENVAIRETKPTVGQRIIISTWKNISGNPFNSFPICLAIGVNNEKVDKATYAFEKLSENMHPHFVKIWEMLFLFLSSEFIKDAQIVNKKRYEYLYSAFFADRILTKFNEGDPTPNYDCLIYPSVAWNHVHDNVAVMPESVDKKLKIVHAREYEVLETYYDKTLALKEFPAKLKFIREARLFNNDSIVWDDDLPPSNK